LDHWNKVQYTFLENKTKVFFDQFM
jgi:hypothetical protein